MKKIVIILFLITAFYSQQIKVFAGEPSFSLAKGEGTNVPAASGQTLSSLLSPLFEENRDKSGAYILEKGEESLLARAWISEHAEKSIDVQYFIWSVDNIGILATEFLLRAADRGVQVRVIVDDLLIDAPDKTLLALASHPNIDVKIYNPKHSVGVPAPKRIFNMLVNFKSFNQRMHDKTFIVDGSIAITGGRNMADEYFDYDHEYNFRDRDILLLGPVVGDMKASFQEFWDCDLAKTVEELLDWKEKIPSHEEIQKIYEELHVYAQNSENFAPEVRQALDSIPVRFPQLVNDLVWEDIKFFSDIPGKNEAGRTLKGGGRITGELIEAISKARKSITIQSPYLIFPDDGIEYFGDLVKKGVEVRINTNSLASTDNLYAFSGYNKQRKKILKAGIKIYEFRPDPDVQKKLIERYASLEKMAPTFAIHAKTMVIDSSVLYVGTFNLDPRSANLNTEVGVLIENEKLASQVEASIENDMAPLNSWDAADDPNSNATFGKRMEVFFLRLFPMQSVL